MLVVPLESIRHATSLRASLSGLASKLVLVGYCISPHSKDQVRHFEPWGHNLEQSKKPGERSGNLKLGSLTPTAIFPLCSRDRTYDRPLEMEGQSFDHFRDQAFSMVDHCGGENHKLAVTNHLAL